jgi:hypothetical protein
MSPVDPTLTELRHVFADLLLVLSGMEDRPHLADRLIEYCVNKRTGLAYAA